MCTSSSTHLWSVKVSGGNWKIYTSSVLQGACHHPHNFYTHLLQRSSVSSWCAPLKEVSIPYWHSIYVCTYWHSIYVGTWFCVGAWIGRHSYWTWIIQKTSLFKSLKITASMCDVVHFFFSNSCFYAVQVCGSSFVVTFWQFFHHCFLWQDDPCVQVHVTILFAVMNNPLVYSMTTIYNMGL